MNQRKINKKQKRSIMQITNLKEAQEILKMKKYLTEIYVKHNTAGKTFEQLTNDMERDNFMSAEEAVAYGLADRIITSRE